MFNDAIVWSAARFFRSAALADLCTKDPYEGTWLLLLDGEFLEVIVQE